MSEKDERERGRWPSDRTPAGWERLSFREVAENVTSSTRKLKQKDYRDIGRFPVVDQGQGEVAGYSDDEALVHPGPVPAIVFGDHTRCTKLVATSFVQGADGVKVLAATPLVEAEFLYWGLKTLELPNKGYSRHFKFLRNSDFPVAPLNEQRRIVAKLDACMTHTKKAKEALDAIPPLLEKFRQSVLAAAFRGELTKDWREKNKDVEPASELLKRIRVERRQKWEEDYLEKQRAKGKEPKNDKWKAKYKEPVEPEFLNAKVGLPTGWTWVSIDTVAECLDSQRVPITRKDRTAGPYPYYGANGEVDRVNDWLFDEPLVLVTEDETFYGRTKPIAFRVDGRCWVNNHAHVLRPLAPLDTRYVAYSLMHYPVWPWLTGTTGRAKLTQGALKRLPVALPPLAELRVILSRVENALSRTVHVPSNLSGAEDLLAKLTAALLAKAFRGELVPQDPNDEPASVLLERIRAEGAAAEAAKPKKKRRTSKAKESKT